MPGFSLQMENIRFAYPGKQGSFALEVEYFSPGQCTALLGPNGSGKTTLGKLAAGILKPQSGRVAFDGQDIADWRLGKIGQHVGYLFQDPSRQIFAPHPLEEIAFPLELRGMPKPEAEVKARGLLVEFKLDNILDSTTYTLSRGEKQRLAIAAIMAVSPKYFILDEPTTGLDKRMRETLTETLRGLVAKGVGILLITHDRSFAENLDADIRHIEGGRLQDG